MLKRVSPILSLDDTFFDIQLVQKLVFSRTRYAITKINHLSINLFFLIF